MKLIQELGKPVYTNKRKIRENKPSRKLIQLLGKHGSVGGW